MDDNHLALTPPVKISQILANLLDQNLSEIASSWMMHVNENVSFQTGGAWEPELLHSCRRGVASIIEYLRTGTTTTLDRYLNELCQVNLEDGFESGEVSNSLLLMKKAILPKIQSNFPVMQADGWMLLNQLDDCLNMMVRRFNQAYTTEMNQRVKEQHLRMALLLRISQDSQGYLKIEEVLEQVARGIMAAVGIQNALIYQVSDGQDQLIYQQSVRHTAAEAGMPVMLSEQLLESFRVAFLPEIIQTHQPLACNNPQNDSRVRQAAITTTDLKSFLAVPIVVFEKVTAIVIVLTYPDYRSFTTEQIELSWEIATTASLALENGRLYTENSQRLAETQSIQRVTSALLQELKIEKVLEVVCNEAQELTGAGSSAVYFLEKEDQLRLVFFTGQPPTLQQIPLRDSLTGRALLEDRPLSTNHPEKDTSVYDSSLAPMSLLAAPLIANGRSIGVLDMANKPGGFSENDERIIRIYAGQAAIAIENARLHQQVRNLAVLEERERLAREIHDNVAQEMGAFKLQASFARDLLRDGNADQAREILEQQVRAATEAQAGLREAIYGLRNSPSLDGDLVATLRDYLEKYHEKYGLEIHLNLSGETSLTLEPQSTIQLTRIIQEALANVRKHAHASRVEVTLKRNQDMLEICIEDRGQGFNPGEVLERDTGGVGLQVMRERAESVKGRLEVDSAPGGGTRIRCWMPISRKR